MFEKKYFVMKQFKVTFELEDLDYHRVALVERIVRLKKPFVGLKSDIDKVNKRVMERYDVHVSLLAGKILGEVRHAGRIFHCKDCVIAGGSHISKCFWGKLVPIEFEWNPMDKDSEKKYKEFLRSKKCR